MDWCLIGAAFYEWAFWSWIIDPSAWLVILLVAVGLGAVIFIHELGHFAVAKLCGVKCEKFYLGFDIAGWRICRFRWGETEYGIGAIPLGGYVKMLGQEDNPARLKQEIERAKAAQAAEALGVRRDAQEEDDAPPIDLAEAEAALYDPRSYLAQSVPKRMAIISAGVIMNLIFAFVVAVIAYLIGVNEQPAEIGPIQPGYPAWQCDLRPGDRMIEINGEPARRFKDLQSRIPLNKKGTAATLRIERPGVSTPIDVVIHPTRQLLIPAVGIAGSHTTTLRESAGWLNNRDIKPYLPNTAAARATPPLAPGDKIVAVDGAAVETGWQLREALSARRAKRVTLTVQRKAGKDKPAERVAIQVDPQPMRDIGMIMEMGPVVGVQDGSPAAEAGIRANDRITAVDGQPVADPLRLAGRLWTQADEAAAQGKSPPTVTLTIERIDEAKGQDGRIERKKTTLDVPVTLRKTDAFETPLFEGGPVSVPSLGVAYTVLNKVAAVVPGSPAAQAGIKPGDVLAEATLVPPSDEALAREGLDPRDVAEKWTIDEFTDEKPNWPIFLEAVQRFTLPGSTVKLTFKDGKSVSVAPAEMAEWFNPERGLDLQEAEFTLTAKSLGEAMKLGGERTLLEASLVLRLLQRLSTGDISFKVLGGPVSIAKFAGRAASRSLSEFLLFLTMISAMLAVVNFLPIPVLDGGHFVFLLYEGIRGKPADERVQLALSYVGLVLILALMLWALGLDFGMISRN